MKIKGKTFDAVIEWEFRAGEWEPSIYVDNIGDALTIARVMSEKHAMNGALRYRVRSLIVRKTYVVKTYYRGAEEGND